MDIKQQIRREIERLIDDLGEQIDVYLEDLLAFVDSLPEEKPSEDLEREVELYIETERYFPDDEKPIVMEIARHFAEWQKAKMKEQIDKKVEFYKKSWYEEGKIAGKYEGLKDDEKYQQGLHDGKEELMREAVEAKIYGKDEQWIESELLEHPIGVDGDTVKIIVIKKDKEDEDE